MGGSVKGNVAFTSLPNIRSALPLPRISGWTTTPQKVGSNVRKCCKGLDRDSGVLSALGRYDDHMLHADRWPQEDSRRSHTEASQCIGIGFQRQLGDDCPHRLGLHVLHQSALREECLHHARFEQTFRPRFHPGGVRYFQLRISSARARSSCVLMLRNGSTGSDGKLTRTLGNPATKSSIFLKPSPRSMPSEVTGRLTLHTAKTG